jgi:molybdopterin converting factor small subunit
LVTLVLPDGITVGEFRDKLVAEYQALSPLISHLFVAVNGDYAADSAVIRRTDEVACFPPVSGG